jgi:hypothetical protein
MRGFTKQDVASSVLFIDAFWAKYGKLERYRE